jgi:hypothetical protein
MGFTSTKAIDYSGQLKVYQLVNQTSGLADFEADKPRGGKSVLAELMAGHDRSIDTAEALKITRNLPPHFAPGTPGRAYYSNLNYRLLGEIIEAISEKPMAINFRGAHLRAAWFAAHLSLRLDKVPPRRVTRHTLFEQRRGQCSPIPVLEYIRWRPGFYCFRMYDFPARLSSKGACLTRHSWNG